MASRRETTDESGLTLVEVVIASALTLLLLMMGYGILSTSSKTAAAITNRAQNSTAARLAIDALEADLRFANGVWLCAPVTTTPLVAGSATVACPTVTTSTAVLVSVDPNLSSGTTGNRPSCSEWMFSGGALDQVDLGTVSNGSIPLTPLANDPGVSAWINSLGATTGFSLPSTVADASAGDGGVSANVINRLVQIDLSVNLEPTRTYNSGDTVTVHDLIAPQNLPLQDDTSLVPCS